MKRNLTVKKFNTVLSICEYFKVPMSDFCKWGEEC